MIVRGRIKRQDLQQHADVCVTFLEKNGVFSAIIGSDHRFGKSKLNRNDIESLNRSLNISAENLVRRLRIESAGVPLSEALTDPDMGLASRGHAALNAIFDTDSDLVRIDTKDSIDIPVFEIHSDEFLVPWEWLFDAAPARIAGHAVEEILDNFWGLNRIVVRQRLGQSHSPYILRDKPVVGVAINDNLTYAKKELDDLIESERAGKLELRVFSASQDEFGWGFIEKFNKFISDGDLDILHLACHGQFVPEDPMSSYLDLGDSRIYRVSHMYQRSNLRVGASIVFFNACSTGVRQPLQTFDFVRRFAEKGGENIIAIESAVESEVASVFSGQFYEALVAGAPLGKAVYNARRAAVRNSGNPKEIVALFYSVYGNPFCYVSGARMRTRA